MEVETTKRAETVAAIFPNEASAHAAMRELEQIGFRDAWVGVVRAGEFLTNDIPIVDGAEGGGVCEAIGRFFGGEGDRSLHAVLTSRGITSERARRLVREVRPGNAVLTVVIEGVDGRALETIEAYGGDIGRNVASEGEVIPDLQERSAGFA
jgi:hypothetical protein